MKFFSSTNITPSDISILLLNGRSVLSKLHSVFLLASLYQPTFICITETWLTPCTPDAALSIPGYTIYRADRMSHRGGGCLVYANMSIQTESPSDPTLQAYTDASWVSVTIGASSILLGCIYNPPPSTAKSIENIACLLNQVSGLPYNACILVGDFNWPEIKWHELSQTALPPRFAPFLAEFLMDGWEQIVLKPTRGSHILDLVFIKGLPTTNALVGPLFPGSDHNLVLSFIPAPTAESPILSTTPSWPTRHKISPIIMDCFINNVRMTDWTNFFLVADVQAATDELYHQLTTILNSLSPSLPAKPRQRACITRRNTKVKSLTEDVHHRKNILAAIQLHKLVSSQIASRLKQERSQEFQVLSAINKPEGLGRLFNRRCPNSRNVVHSICNNGSLSQDPYVICNTLNDFFASCYSPPTPTTVFRFDPNLTSQQPSRLLSTIRINYSDVEKYLHRLKESSYSGSDGLPPTVLKHGGGDIIFLLTHLFNLSVESGHFPTQWKQSVITPRFKSGPRTLCSSYRGIHHTPVISRVFERCVNGPILQFFLETNQICDRQYGFLSRRSVNSCHAHFFSHINKIKDSGKGLVLLFLDITKAFDRVPHSKLLDTLVDSGVRPPLLSWFSSYLSDRHQRTLVSHHLSNKTPICSGVIQGSVLGPTLFLRYVDSITSHISGGEAFLFADDIKVAYAVDLNDADSTLTRIQLDLKSLESWSSTSGLQFSADKCQVLSFRHHVPPNKLTLNNYPIALSKEIRDLGLRYSCTFSFSAQISYQVARARKLSSLILRSFHISETKIELFKQIIRPSFEFCTIFSAQYTRHETSQIESVQRFFTRMILQPHPSLSYRSRCHALDLEPLWLRRLKLNLRFLHKLVYNHVHLPENRPTFRNPSKYSLRNFACSVNCPISKGSSTNNFFLSMYPRIWNKLPPDLRSLYHPKAFQLELNRYLDPITVAKLLCTTCSIDFLYERGPGRL